MMNYIFAMLFVVSLCNLGAISGCSKKKTSLDEISERKWESVSVRLKGRNWQYDDKLEVHVRDIIKKQLKSLPATKELSDVFEINIVLGDEKKCTLFLSSHSWRYADQTTKYQSALSKENYDYLYNVAIQKNP